MKRNDNDDTPFPIDVHSRTINFFQSLLLVGIKFLALLMTLTIIWSILDVAYYFYVEMIQSKFFTLDLDKVLSLFGAFLIVLIAIEIFLNIILYLRRDMNHLKLVVATALMAISRKVIILDYNHANASLMFSMAAIIAALGVAYWLIVRSHQNPISNESSSSEDKN